MNKPNAEFLEELRERVRCYGWQGDYIELEAFVRDLYDEAGAECPDMTPYGAEDT